jgi:hypothetical protein
MLSKIRALTTWLEAFLDGISIFLEEPPIFWIPASPYLSVRKLAGRPRVCGSIDATSYVRKP